MRILMKSATNNGGERITKLPIVVILACTALATGCATHHQGDMRNREPVAIYSSTNNAKNVALCVADGWEKNGNMSAEIKMRPSANGYSVWVDIDVNVLMKNLTVQLVDAEDTQTGSATRFYSGTSDINEWRKVVDRCAGNPTNKTNAAPEQVLSDSTGVSLTSQKLRELQALRKDGLITEEEYQRKKQQLLEKF